MLTPKRHHIPITILDNIPNTQIYTRENTKKLIELWNAGVPVAEVMEKTNLKEGQIRVRLRTIFTKMGLRKQTSRMHRYTENRRPQNKTFAGRAKCLKCLQMFDSENVKANRICPLCKHADRNTDDYGDVPHLAGTQTSRSIRIGVGYSSAAEDEFGLTIDE